MDNKIDELEEEYKRLIKISKSTLLERYVDVKKLKELGDLLKYRRMRKELKGLNVDKLARDLIEDINAVIDTLERL